MATLSEEFGQALAEHSSAFGIDLSDQSIDLLKQYYALLLKWNERLHLVAPCSPDEFAIRHVLESLLLVKHLPRDASVVDVGSGGGLPIIPCLIARDDLTSTLIESATRKAVFLREALRDLSLSSRAQVVNERFADVPSPDAVYLTCRALDRFAETLGELVRWAKPGTTFLLFAGQALTDQVRTAFQSIIVEKVPESDRRYLLIARQPN